MPSTGWLKLKTARNDSAKGATPESSGANPSAKVGEGSSGESDGLPPGVKVGLGGLGLAATLAAAGFIGKVALQQFLGVELGNWSAQDLSNFAGRWAIDSASVVLTQILDNWLLFGAACIFYLAPMVLALSFSDGSRVVRISTLLSAGLASVALVLVLTWWEIPTLSLNGWLMTDIADQLQPPAPGFLHEREADLRVTLLVSKMGGLASHFKVNCDAAPTGSSGAQTPAKLPAGLLKALDSDSPDQSALTKLQQIYTCTLIVCLGAWFTLFLKMPSSEPLVVQELFRAARLIMVFVLLPLVSSLIPYMYAKLLYPTSFPQVTLIYTNGNVSPTKMWILDETEKEMLLLPEEDAVDNENAGQYIPQTRQRDEIKRMRFYGNSDVFTTMLLSCKWTQHLQQPQ
jgi:hypothetical protein